MDIGPQFLEPLLLLDPEMLFLVHHHQSQAFEADGLRQQGVGAHQDVEGAVAGLLADARGVLGRDQPRQLFHPDRQAGEPGGKGAVMLARQQGGRNHNGDLQAGERSHKGRAQCHLGLAETDIATDQPVHRSARTQVHHHVGDGVGLVLRLGIGEARREFGVKPVVDRQWLALAQFPLGGNPQQGLGHVLQAFGDAGAAALPGGAAQPVKLGAGLFRAVPGQQVEILHGHEQLFVAVVDDAQAVVGRARNRYGFEPVEAADPVLHMDHQIPNRQPGRLGDEVGGAPTLARRAGQPVAEDVLLGDDRKVGRDEAVLDAEHRHGEAAAAEPLGLGPGFRGLESGDAVVGQHRLQPLPRPLAVARHHHPPAALGQFDDVLVNRIEDVEIGTGAGLGKVVAATTAGVTLTDQAGRHREGRKLGHRMAAGDQVPVVPVEIEPAGRQRLVGRDAGRPVGGAQGAAGFVKVGDLGQPGVPRLLGLVVEAEDRLGQIVRQGFQGRMEQRQPVFHAGMPAAGADRLVKRILVGDGPEQLAVAGAKAGDGRLVEEQLGHGLQPHPVALFRGALGQRIEGADAFQVVAEQVEPERLLGAGREQVDDAAAHGVLAGFTHRLGPTVAVMGQVTLELFQVQALADSRLEAGLAERAARRQLLDHAVDGGQNQPAPSRRHRFQDPGQGVDAPADDGRIGRQPVIGQAVPGGKGQDLQFRGEKRQHFGELRRPTVVEGDMKQPRRPGLGRQRRQHPGIGTLGRAPDQQAAGPARGEIDLQQGGKIRCGRAKRRGTPSAAPSRHDHGRAAPAHARRTSRKGRRPRSRAVSRSG